MNLLKALATVGSMTLLSRLLGFVRDTVIARVFGAGIYSDAFFVAFKIPNLLRRLFAEGAFSQAFVPVLAEYKARQGHEATHLLADHVASLLALALLVVTAIGVVAAPAVIYFSAPGFSASAEKFDLTVQLLRFTFPYIFFISLVSLAGGILNTYSRFSVPAFTPVLLNISLIACALWASPLINPPVLALALGVLLGGVLQLVFQVPFLLRLDMLPRFRLSFGDEGVWRIVKLMGPAVFGVSIAQLSLLINTIFASFLADGSVSWLYYADRLMEFPAGVLGVAVGTILLPSLSKCHANNDMAEYSRLLDWGLRLTIMLTLPAALALGMIAVPLLATFFQHGAFSAHDVLMTRGALVGYSVGLIGMILVKILAPGFYAKQDIRTPVKIGIATLVATQLMNLAFIGWLQHAGLALAIGLGACFNSAILFRLLRKRDIYRPEPGWALFFAKVCVALLALGLALWFGMGAEQSWLTRSGWPRILHLAALVAGGVAVYFAVLAALGFRLRDFSRRAVS